MNYVNTTMSHNVPYVYNGYNPSTYGYCYTDADGEYTNYLAAEEERRKAVKAIYTMGYITKEEANQLLGQDVAYRNKYTEIRLDIFTDRVIISCYENDPCATQIPVILFQLEYLKSSGKVQEVEAKVYFNKI